MRPSLSDALLRTQTDERLVALTRAGHERAFAAIVERYRRPLVAFARGVSDERAEDVVQQSLLSAWAALAAGAEVAHLRGWLHQIVRHEAGRVAQREGRAAHGSLDEAALAGVEAPLDQRLAVRETFAGIAELPSQQREALVQTAVVGRSRSEVAATLGLSEGAVRQLVHRARATLRTAVTAITPFPLANWVAGLGGGPGVPELVGGAGAAGIAGTLLKAGTVVVATGALATGATVATHRTHHAHRTPPAVTATTPAATTPATTGGGSGREAEPGDDRSGRGQGGGSDDSGSGRGKGSGSEGSGSGRSGSSGSGSGRDDSSGRGSSSGGSGSSGSSGSSGGSGSGRDDSSGHGGDDG